MALQSMTGFARAEGRDDIVAWVCEARSVNGKGLDLRCRLPQGCDALEPAARRAAAGLMARGSVTVTVSLGPPAGEARLIINQAVLDRVLEIATDIMTTAHVAPATVDGLLKIPGVLETGAEAAGAITEERLAAIGATLEEALAGLAAARRDEGRHLREALLALLDDIDGLVARAADHAAAQPEAIRARLAGQVEEMLAGRAELPAERLVQEAALLATKADIREEIDRLKGHCAAARELIETGEAPGRRLGFLNQELLREANTLTAKSADADLTAVGLDLKVAIDQLREQALNVE